MLATARDGLVNLNVNLTNCSSGSALYWTPVAGVLVVSLTVHAIAAPHGFAYPQLPPEEHTELSSKSTAAVGIYAPLFAITSSGTSIPSSGPTIRF